MRRYSRRSLLLGTAAVVVAACTPSAAETPPGPGRPASPLAANAELGVWPAVAKQWPLQVRQAYEYAARRPASLRWIPCYCGCGGSGHENNQDCYVSEFAGDGWAVLDTHGAACGTCVGITLDVMRYEKQGQSIAEIRRLVDLRWAKVGPGTNTPLPPS